jgi:sulfatase maturation enzyme AslB (radical SAM superfamily)
MPDGRPAGHSIESGYFVFTMMPSLFCKLRCPHCYLSLEQRKDRSVMPVESVREACRRVDAYYDRRGLQRRTVMRYWYGGEPTSMGDGYFRAAADAMDEVFDPAKGYDGRHIILTALVGVDLDVWLPVFDRYGQGEFQTSYDAEMRGVGYVRLWEKAVRQSVTRGLRVSTISVVNRSILDKGPEATLDYLADLGVAETSWLPYMANEQNLGTGMYGRFAPTMSEWSEFMVALAESWLQRRSAGRAVPEIGQLRFVMEQRELPLAANLAGQTLFLLPDGQFVLPDYRDGWVEFMRPFGNILEQDFESVLSSPARRAYLRRQALRNGNPECLSCEHAGHCVMEFWKPNRAGDDCFGGRRFVEWAVANEFRLRPFIPRDSARLF